MADMDPGLRRENADNCALLSGRVRLNRAGAKCQVPPLVRGRAWLGDLADQQVVGSWGCADANAEQRIERGMSCPTPIEAEHELIEVVLEVGPPQSVVNAQAPALEI